MIQAMSAYHWKKKNGEIHLYTTAEDLEFFRELGIDALYDKIDTEVLEKEKDVFWPHFYPASKMVVLNSLPRESFPVAFIDTDFIYRETIEVGDEDIAFLHDEVLFNKNYPPLEMLGRREEYSFPEFPELKTANPINVGFFIVNNSTLAKDYSDLAMKYMRKNFVNSTPVSWASDGLRIFWKSLFVEQRLLGAFVKHHGYKTRQIFPYTYHGDTATWINPLETTDTTTLNTTQLPFYHLWGEKNHYDKPEGFNNRVLTFYRLAETLKSLEEEQMTEILYEIISYTAEKTHIEVGEDFYRLREYIKL
jgi:hypothetical protein